jgi:hypothetical protein
MKLHFLPLFLISISASATPLSRHVVGNVNRYLSNSARTDLIGPEIWTGPAIVKDERTAKPDLREGTVFGPQMPGENWGSPRMGLQGTFCAGHQTALNDLIGIKAAETREGATIPLEFVPTRHYWTPAYSITWYRSLPTGAPGTSPLAGNLQIKETKCITPENVFVASLEILNDQRESIILDLELISPELKSDGPGGAVTLTAVTNVGGIAKGGKGWKINSGGWVATTGDPGFGTGLPLPPQKTHRFRYAFAIDETGTDNARQRVEAALAEEDPFMRNEKDFNSWYATNVPALHCEDPDLMKLYYYRWLVVKRSIHDPKKFIEGHPYKRPAMYESPVGDWFCAVIGLPVPMQIEEARWCRDVTIGKNHLLNWAENVHPQYQSYLQYTSAAAWNFYKVHPDAEILHAVTRSAAEYAWKNAPVRDHGDLPVQTGSWGTGAEYQPNFYQFTKPEPWDWRHDLEGQSKGFPFAKSVRLDKASYTIANLCGASRLMDESGDAEASAEAREQADRMMRTVRERHWKDGFFYAADPETYALADQAPCYDGFMPFMNGMLRDSQYFGAFDRLFDPAWFWSEFPATTVARTNPMYWSGNAIAGPTASSIAKPHSYACSWNGPMWNYSNTAIAGALGSVAASPGGERFRTGWLDFHRRWSDSHFIYGDRSVPCAMEHLRPTDGANFRRGVVDYFHSAWLDVTFSYWAGIRISDDRRTLVFDPFTHEDFRLEHVPAGGRELSFIQKDGKRFVLDEVGIILAEGEAGEPVELPVERS